MNSAIKGLSWLIAGAAATFAVAYLLTGKADMAASVSVIAFIIQIPLYWGHERLWGRFNKTKQESTPFVLWFTGLSGAGKSAIADAVHGFLTKNGRKVAR